MALKFVALESAGLLCAETSAPELRGGLGRCGAAGWTRGPSGGDGQLRGRESAPEGTETRQTATPPRAPRQAALCQTPVEGGVVP